jgi:hypothetical protein
VSETRLYDNPATQSERREVLKDTYLSRAQSDADLTSQGRFKRETTNRITGVPEYPSQPANSPWASNPVPPDPASDQLGYEIDAMEGTPAEVQKSIRDVVGVGALPSADDLGGLEAPTDVNLPSDVETKPAQPSKDGVTE